MRRDVVAPKGCIEGAIRCQTTRSRSHHVERPRNHVRGYRAGAVVLAVHPDRLFRLRFDRDLAPAPAVQSCIGGRQVQEAGFGRHEAQWLAADDEDVEEAVDGTEVNVHRETGTRSARVYDVALDSAHVYGAAIDGQPVF